jgi:hypothetical protein
MSHEIPQPEQPEREYQPRTGLFNVAAMSDDEILLMGRAFEERGILLRRADENDSAADALFSLDDSLTADVDALASSNPERLKELVHRTALSQNAYERCFAADHVASLFSSDWAFARDVIVHLHIADRPSEEVDFGRDYPDSLNEAQCKMTPEQVSDYNAHISLHDPYLTI